MTVSMQTMRNIASVRGDLSGSLMDPTVVGLQGIEISTTLPQDGEALVYNATQDKYIPGVVAADISNLLSSADAASTYETIANVSSSLALKANASQLSLYATTGSNTFRGNQTISGSSNALFVYSTGSTTVSTSAAFKVMQSGSSYGGFSMGLVSNSAYPRLSGLNSAGNTGGAFQMQPDGGDVYMFHGNSKFIMAASFPSLVNTHRFQIYATSPLSGAILIHTGTLDLRNGSLSVTGSANINGNLTAATASITSDLTVGGNLTVNGSRTVVNTTDLTITDNVILIASGAASAAQLNGAGIHFGRLPSEDARIIYDATNDEMEIYPAARSAEFRGAFVGDGSSITGTPYDVAGEVTGSIVSGSELLNYLSPRAFTMQAFSQYTGSGAASAYVMKNGVSSSFPTAVAANDLIAVVSTTTGSKAYFTIKGVL